MPIQEGVDIEKLAQSMSIFAGAAMLDESAETVRRLLR
jgi:hypothetical protein